MRYHHVAALVIGGVVAHVRPAVAVPNVYALQASQCAKEPRDRSGTAFAVKRFRPSQTEIVLVTALHIIHDCRDIRVLALACHDGPRGKDPDRDRRMSVPPKDTIETWPEWDLAVIRVADPGTLKLQHSVQEELAFAQSDLQTLLQADNAQSEPMSYRLPGTSEANHCRRGIVNHTSIRRAGAQYAELAARETRRMQNAALAARAAWRMENPKLASRETGALPRVSVGDLLGSLSKDRWLLNYHGELSGGASGSPVTRADGLKVIAIHEAGFTDRPGSGWGVVIAGSGLEKTEPTNATMGSPWPTIAWSYLAQSAPDSIMAALEDANKKARRTLQLNFVSLMFGLGAHTRDVRAGPAGYELTLGYAFHPWWWHAGVGRWKLGFQIDGSAGSGKLGPRYLSPNGEPLETTDERWFHLAGGIDLRLERVRNWWSPSFSIGGLFGGRWSYKPELAEGSSETDWNPGAWASLKNRIPFACPSSRRVGCFHLVGAMEVTMLYSLTPTFDYQYTGAGGDVVEVNRDKVMGYVGLKLGIELGVVP